MTFKDVGEFHVKFGLPRFGDGRPPEFLTEDLLTFRLGFMLEELSEFCAAHSRKDMAGCLDALNDLKYVLDGTAHFMALPLDEGHAEVHRKNMQKVSVESADDPRSKRNHKFDIVKPEGWTPPDHNEALIRAAIDALGLDLRAIIHFEGKTFAEFMASPFARNAVFARAVKDAAE
jgi:predicted HAD superfamily Cof-like phosphohydrolase